MSGPATANFVLIPVTIFSWVVDEAKVTGEAYQAALEQARIREQERLLQSQAVKDATAQRFAGLLSNVEFLEGKIQRLMALRGHDVEIPVRPRGKSDEAWSLYLLELERLNLVLGQQLAIQQDETVSLALKAVGDAPDLEGVLQLYLAQRRVLHGLSDADVAEWRVTVERLLGRLGLAPGVPVPEALEALARQIILAETPVRAELLANELRFQIQRLHQEQLVAQAAREFAQQTLASWPAHGPVALRVLLEEVAAGLTLLDDETHHEVVESLEAAAAEEKAALAGASALVLEQSLRDLGYQVEGVEETLFLEGGTAHFQRSEWDGYFVRLRVNAQEQTFNFNVVRAHEALSAGEDKAHRKRMDFMAEERWCAEFPRLLETLSARGLQMEVTRLLGAGELSVQAVDAETLPNFARQESQGRREKQSLTREFPYNK